MVILLTQRRSFGVYTERIERAEEGTRRSNELKRQSNERVIDRITEFELKAELLTDLEKAYHADRSA